MNTSVAQAAAGGRDDSEIPFWPREPGTKLMQERMEYRVSLGQRSYLLELLNGAAAPGVERPHAVRVVGEPRSLQVEVLHYGGEREPSVLRVDGRIVRVPGASAELTQGGQWAPAVRVESELSHRAQATRPGPSASGQLIRSPLPGRVVNVSVTSGDVVSAGQPLLTIEAMKMENEVLAPASGCVGQVHVREGQAIDAEALLLELSDTTA